MREFHEEKMYIPQKLDNGEFRWRGHAPPEWPEKEGGYLLPWVVFKLLPEYVHGNLYVDYPDEASAQSALQSALDLLLKIW